MPKEESSGLFSKVVKFVRSPGAAWSEADQEAVDSQLSKQMLKAMIERKRRNDFVRKREFDMLRKLRRSEVMASQDPAARPSFFQSSLPSKPDDRASTLKKIDEIEAQMSMQWWKAKQGDARERIGSTTNFPMSGLVPGDHGRSAEPTGLGDLAGGGTGLGALEAAARQAGIRPTGPQPLPEPVRGSEPEPVLDAELDFTKGFLDPTVPAAPPTVSSTMFTPPAPAPAPAPGPAAAAPDRGAAMRAVMGLMGRGGRDSVAPSSGFSASKVFAIDVGEFAHDPELEEAAIRFANGDDEGAESGLKEVLAPDGSRVDHEETWFTLFDLFRATGQQERFETFAIDYAARFGRSAPQWVSLPDEVGRMGRGSRTGAESSAPDWTAPVVIGAQTVPALVATLAKAPQPWKLSWARLAAIEETALEPLAKLVGQWCSQPVQLRFIGADVLERVLKDRAVSGDRSVNPAWWKLLMEVLRVMHRPDEFELVALDYCVTYEVSPPSWESSRCEYKAMRSDGSPVTAGRAVIGDASHDTLATFPSSELAEPSIGSTQVSSVELAGQIVGDATEAIAVLDSKLAGADLIVVSCARLIRIDFTAAGSLLNWVSSRAGENRQVQFTEVNRLVAAFFKVVGISEHARVIPRRD
jgi:ABC-type transporter Mla MlaB component